MHRILVVEDDGIICAALTMLLNEAGHETITVQRGNDALGVEARLALVDLTLPDLDGTKVCKELKEKGMRVILMSGRENLRAIAQECGADDFIEKPFDIGELLKKVNRLVA
jgi:DNA-binding response OmpR family regulator